MAEGPKGWVPSPEFIEKLRQRVKRRMKQEAAKVIEEQQRELRAKSVPADKLHLFPPPRSQAIAFNDTGMSFIDSFFEDASKPSCSYAVTNIGEETRWCGRPTKDRRSSYCLDHHRLCHAYTRTMSTTAQAVTHLSREKHQTRADRPVPGETPLTAMF